MAKYMNLSAAELLENSKIPLEIVENDNDIYHEIVREMMDEIKKNNALEKNTVIVIPVGPVFQYKRFVRLAEMEKLGCKNVYIFSMDEYLTDEKEYLSEDSPLSFTGFLNREFYSKLTGCSFIPESHRFFPEPGNENYYYQKMQELGGLDLVIGGIGIKGHIAFNEALDDDQQMSNEEFAALTTRILPLTKETKTINSVTGLGGYIDGIPNWCITVGMKELLSAKKMRFYCNREWQKGIIRKACLDEVSGHTPATFLQLHPDAKLTITSYVAEAPGGVIR